MRLGWLFLLAVGCSGESADFADYDPVEIVPHELVDVSLEPPAMQADVDPELCFDIPSDVRSAFPSIEAEAQTAAAAWGLPFRADADCANWMTIEADELFEHPEYAAQMRRHIDGYRVLRFRLSAVETGVISDTVSGCGIVDSADGPIYQAPMLAILLHEFGHALGVKHTPDGLMAAKHEASCDVVWPSAGELAAADAARRTPPPQP
jgi:hypothetical protein